MKLIWINTLIWYDGPQAVHMETEHGSYVYAVAVDDSGWFLGVEVPEEHREAYKSRQIDYRDFIHGGGQKFKFKLTDLAPGRGRGEVEAVETTMADADREFNLNDWPEAGHFYHADVDDFEGFDDR